MGGINWWERRWFLAFLIVLSSTPLIWPETPPLVDVPGHMGRFRVQLDLQNSQTLKSYFEFHWALIGNLGVDLLVQVIGPILGLEPAVKLVVILIPPLTAVGLIWTAREVHGQIQPTTMFAIPFIYSYPFNFGFINFALSLAIALIAFAFWLHLTTAGRFVLRSWLFVPISCLLWVTHVFGWGVVGLLALSAELLRQRELNQKWADVFIRTASAVLPLAPPLALMLVWRSGTSFGDTGQFFDLSRKLFALAAALRDRWLLLDCFSVGVAVVLIGASFFEKSFAQSTKLFGAVATLSLAFLVMPARVFGSAYADMRLAPLIMMVAILAIYIPKPRPRLQKRLAWLGLAFVVLRTAGNTLSFGLADRETRETLAVLALIPQGAPVAFLTGDFCHTRWKMQRMSHIGSFVIVRNDGFSNDQWQSAGAQLSRVVYLEAHPFIEDPSQLISARSCLTREEAPGSGPAAYGADPNAVLAAIPRDAFDYIWTVDLPNYEIRPGKDLTPIWRGPGSTMYRIEKPKSAAKMDR